MERYARTHLGHEATVVSRNNLELYTTLDLPRWVGFARFGHIPQTDIIRGGTYERLISLVNQSTEVALTMLSVSRPGMQRRRIPHLN